MGRRGTEMLALRIRVHRVTHVQREKFGSQVLRATTVLYEDSTLRHKLHDVTAPYNTSRHGRRTNNP